MGGSVIANNENFNPYALGNQMERFVLSKGFNEMMFYGNLNTGEQFPWQAESWSLASDNKTVTIKIRDGVVWRRRDAFHRRRRGFHDKRDQWWRIEPGEPG